MSPQKTSVDWLRFRTQATPLEGLEALKPLFGDLGQHLRLKLGQRGVLGFQQAAQLVIGDMVLGRVDFGGESQRGWVRWDIPGQGCSWVKDWDAIEEVERLAAADIRRLDVCLTTWDGEVGHDDVVKAHAAGRFYGATAGRPPALRQITSSDPRAGRTCEVGKREKADKFSGAMKRVGKWLPSCRLPCVMGLFQSTVTPSRASTVARSN